MKRGKRSVPRYREPEYFVPHITLEGRALTRAEKRELTRQHSITLPKRRPNR